MVTTTTKNITIGTLLILIATTLIIVVNMQHGLKIEVGKNETRFYIFQTSSPELSGNWTLSGIESWKLYISGKTYSPSVTIKNNVLQNNKTQIIRTSKYSKNNATIIDTYLFDGNEQNIELFPIDHKIEIINCSNCTYKYIYGIFSPRMKLSYEKPDLTQTNTLSYNIAGSRIINIRMFDPLWNVSGNYTKNLPSLDPIPAYSNSILNCSIYADLGNFTNVTYSNGTNYTMYFWYFKNGIQQTKYNGVRVFNYTPVITYAPSLVTENLTSFDTWNCRIRITTTENANVSTSPLLISNYLIISNSPPTITLVSPVNSSSTPATVYTNANTVPTLQWTGSDLNNDTLTYEVYGASI